MSKTMKASCRMQRGKGGKGARHCDRTNTQGAEHIDPTRADNNCIFIVKDNKLQRVEQGKGIVEANELDYYRKRYEAGRQIQREKHIKSRHYKKAEECTVEKYYESARTAPDQMLLQIGKASDKVTMEELEKVTKAYIRDIAQTYHTSNARIRILDINLHGDETTNHGHVSFVLEYLNPKTNCWEVNQKEALRALGYELPNKDRKRSRKNNEKVVWTEEVRQKWYDKIEELLPDIKIDREPDKEKKYNELDHEIGKKEQTLIALEDSVEALKAEKDKLGKESVEIEDYMGLMSQIEAFKKRTEKERKIIEPGNIIGERMLDRQEKELTAFQQQILAKIDKKKKPQERGWDYDDR